MIVYFTTSRRHVRSIADIHQDIRTYEQMVWSNACSNCLQRLAWEHAEGVLVCLNESAATREHGVVQTCPECWHRFKVLTLRFRRSVLPYRASYLDLLRDAASVTQMTELRREANDLMQRLYP